jgi:hypothetical protein
MKMSDDGEEQQLDFFFWLGAEGEGLKSVTKEEFGIEQEKWDGQRPNNGNN